jgi:hypothetical protein
MSITEMKDLIARVEAIRFELNCVELDVEQSTEEVDIQEDHLDAAIVNIESVGEELSKMLESMVREESAK